MRPKEQQYQGYGVIVSIDQRKARLIIDHDEIPGFMAPMVMSYQVEPPTLLQDLAPEKRVLFTINAAKRAIVDIEPAP